jgi:hypothetical protein
MNNDLITPENVSKEMLKSVFDAAYLNATLDSDDLLSVKEDSTIFISLNEAKDKISLATYYRFTADSSEVRRLQLVNKINNEYIIVRAIAESDDTLCFSWDISIEGGITPKNFVLSVRRFGSLPRAIIQNCETDIVE